MPIYKALILNKEINVNYDEKEKEKLLEAIKLINQKLKSHNNFDGKISDSKLLSFLAIKLQAEILSQNEKKLIEVNIKNKLQVSNNENIQLNDQLVQLEKENSLLEKEKIILQELTNLQSKVEIIIRLIKRLMKNNHLDKKMN